MKGQTVNNLDLGCHSIPVITTHVVEQIGHGQYLNKHMGMAVFQKIFFRDTAIEISYNFHMLQNIIFLLIYLSI